MTHYKSPTGIRTRTSAYENFQGLDTSRDLISKDTGRDQPLEGLVNASCDWRGQIVRDPMHVWREGDRAVSRITFFSRDEVVYAERTDGQTNLVSERGHVLEAVFGKDSNVTSTVFNRKAIFGAFGWPLWSYDGVVYEPVASPALVALAPAFITSVQRRLVVSGVNGRGTMVYISRVDHEDVFPDDEDPNSENVLRAGTIDIANLLGTADEITGISPFEQNKLVIFTADRALIYRLDPDLTQWSQDTTANIQIGCASHNTIVSAGTDLIFCSRSGVYSVKRSTDNGILVFSVSLSDKVDLLYQELFSSVEDKQSISAVFDQDRAIYHIYFPQPGGLLCKRLSIAMNPEGGQPQPKFNTGDFVNARCGAFLGGRLVVGGSSGIFDVLKDGVVEKGGVTPQFEMVTPMLWHGTLTEMKETLSLVVQVSGNGVLQIEAISDSGALIGSMVVEATDDSDDNRFLNVPLSRQYERKWQHRYRGAQYRIRSLSGDGLFRLIGFAVNVKSN